MGLRNLLQVVQGYDKAAYIFMHLRQQPSIHKSDTLERMSDVLVW